MCDCRLSVSRPGYGIASNLRSFVHRLAVGGDYSSWMFGLASDAEDIFYPTGPAQEEVLT